MTTRIRITEGYWCHATGRRDPGAAGHPPERCVVSTAAQAMDWMRACVRSFASGGAEHEPFMAAWHWLADASGLEETLRRLRAGQSYAFGVDTELGRRAWAVHPVLVLPLLSPEAED
ncbi:NUDIX hydrolase [Streptomyces sp.]